MTATICNTELFHENKIDRHYKTDESCGMIPPESCAFEHENGNAGKHSKRYHLLYYFQLYQREWTSVAVISNSVGGNLKTVFEKSHSPRHYYYAYKRPVVTYVVRLEFEMSVPCECHEDIRTYEQ